MDNTTRILFDRYAADVARANGVNSTAVKYNVAPAVEQRLESAIQESSDFLRAINMIGVTQQSGEKLRVGINTTIAGRTNTANNNRRHPQQLDGNDADTYACRKTDYDYAWGYGLLDAWAHQPNYAALLSASAARQQALDRIMVGWNGTSSAAQTDRVANPLLQDVNIGWLQKIRANAPGQRMYDAAGINVGASAADYKNVDALVMDAIQTFIEVPYRNMPGMVAIVGDNILHDKYFPIVNKAQPPSEIIAAELLYSAKQVGGVTPVRVPYFPANTILLTPLNNLSLYWQRSSRRRRIADEPQYNRVANYESVNEDFVVEEYRASVLIENIQFVQ